MKASYFVVDEEINSIMIIPSCLLAIMRCYILEDISLKLLV